MLQVMSLWLLKLMAMISVLTLWGTVPRMMISLLMSCLKRLRKMRISKRLLRLRKRQLKLSLAMIFPLIRQMKKLPLRMTLVLIQQIKQVTLPLKTSSPLMMKNLSVNLRIQGPRRAPSALLTYRSLHRLWGLRKLV